MYSLLNAPQWLHLRARVKTILNSLLHLRQLMSARDELWGKGAGPLRRGIPVVLRSAISFEMGEGG